MAFDRFKRGMKQAFTMATSSGIRDSVDEDETTAGLEYMANRGKGPFKAAEHNARQSDRSQKITRRALYGLDSPGLSAPADKKLKKVRSGRINLGGR